MYKIFILGPQGSGKGTQANLLSQKLGIPALSMGQLLRDETASGSDLGKEIQDVINRGELVSDQLALQILKGRLSREDAKDGYILDGYPRNKAQYEAFASFDAPTAVLVITVPREESVARLMRRAQIEQRPDDTKEAIERRLEIYDQETKPIIDWYRAQGIVHEINGVGSLEDVEARIDAALEVNK